MRFLFSVSLTLVCCASYAQEVTTTKLIQQAKGSIYFNWGYNRDWYTNSTIHFINTKTDDYDFVIVNATAHDKPDMEQYWHIDRLTIPQYDFDIGYFFKNKNGLGLELSWDHLKYVMTDNQVARVTGNIRGKYIDKDTLITPDFVHLQHTNGNNYLMLNLVKRQGILKGKTFELTGIGKIGAGPLMSYTISTILGSHDSGHFHYHGWVAGASLGLRLYVLKYAFLQTDIQGAFANYTNTEMGEDRQGLATHQFYSLQYMWSFGCEFPLGK